jgi:single-strand DNA-binding protein
VYSTTTIEGNLTRAPHLRRSSDGTAHLTFGIMVDRSVRTATGWETAEPTHHWVKVFGALAENVAASLSKGDLVIVAGTVQSEPYVSGDQRRIFTYVAAQTIGLSLRHAVAHQQRTARRTPPPQPAEDTPPPQPAAPVPAPPSAPVPAPSPAPATRPASQPVATVPLRAAVPATSE